MPSFDTVLEPNLVELRNAVDQSGKEIGTRFDFKGSSAKVELTEKGTAREIVLFGDSDFQISQVRDVVLAKLTKRSVDIRFLDLSARIEKIGGDKVNFFAHYEIDGEDENDVPHALQLDEYRTTDDAEYDSWLLLEPLESPGGEGLDGEMEAGAAEPEEPAAAAMEVDAA